MTLADLWIAIPLLILAGCSLIVLLFGAIIPRNYGTIIGTTAATCAALWTIQSPPVNLAPTLALAATPLSRLFTTLFCIISAAVLVISHKYNERLGIVGEEFPATVLFATFGMTALCMATNLLILFMGLEAMTFAFYILVAMDLKRATSAEAGLKYLLMGAVAASFLAFGIGLHYAGTGSLSIYDAMRMAVGSRIAMAGWGFILIGIAFKLSLVPAHLWTPDVYQGAPAPVAAFLSAGSKAATVVMLLLLLPQGNSDNLRTILWWLALLSMTIGNLAALMQSKVRRMLAYSSIAQMGYVVLALMSGKGGGYQAAAYYAIAYSATSLAAFGAIALIECDDAGDAVDDWRGLGRRSPFVAGILALSLFSLAGIPPTVGFTGKFMIFTAAIKAGETTLAIIGILSAAVSVYYYLRVVISLYMQEHRGSATVSPSIAESTVLIAVSASILILGAFPSQLIRLIRSAIP
jgi:NADH-quinone oxidoreductase subunit N